MDKAELRARMRVIRRRLAAEHPDAPARIGAHALTGRFPGASVYSLYHPVGSELDPSSIRLPSALLALPVATGRDCALVFRLHEPGDPLVIDAFGIPAPAASATEVDPDVVFTPVLAFDRAGGRLGQGAGCYDRTIEALRARKPVKVVGVAYSGQELREVPTEAHDQRLDAILTETEFVLVR